MDMMKGRTSREAEKKVSMNTEHTLNPIIQRAIAQVWYIQKTGHES
ncbi:hypothetical protein KFV02_04045 [Desulfohalobiaceae bacterium Ax17]|nr:hypothetical protein [Desulfovulcanus ferrireducens]MBT8763098.1 hypothetical protein [Desulfovulcanus ferrireducens]